VKFLTKTADRLVDLVVPHATAGAVTYFKMYCECVKGKKWYADCYTIGDPPQIKCNGCNIPTNQSC
jgi:hypothetical protein